MTYFTPVRHECNQACGEVGTLAVVDRRRSQIKNPISVGGRILDVFMEIYAITVIAMLAGALGSFLQKRGQELDDKR
jgi:hypothetical protein